MSLTKTQLIKNIASDTGLIQKKSREILTVMLDIFIAALAIGDIISIRGFGKFYSINQKERKIRHPLTGQIMTVGPRRTIKFKSFKFLREEINDYEFDFDEFRRQNMIILQQLYDLIENSGDYGEDEEEDAVHHESGPMARQRNFQLLS